MSLVTAVKQLSIASGLFRPASDLSRRLRPEGKHNFLNNVHFYQRLLPAGALCFDVGANVGMKSEALLGAGMRVVAFEPNPQLLPELRARCDHDSNWMLVPTAMGSGPGIATLNVRRQHGLSSLNQDWQGGRASQYPVISRCHVPVVTLDAAIANFGKPFYGKIDVEGWELEVLKGLTQPIPLVSFEFHLFDEDITKTVACLKRLLELGADQVNIMPSEGYAFHLPEWAALEQFVQQFPGDLKRSLPGDPQDLFADIFVRLSAAA